MNIFIDYKRGEEPITAAARELMRRPAQGAGGGERSPLSYCLPTGMPNRWFYDRLLTIFQTPKHLMIFMKQTALSAKSTRTAQIARRPVFLGWVIPAALGRGHAGGGFERVQRKNKIPRRLPAQ